MRDITFIRWGNISPSKQLGYGKRSFHSPPTKKGLYAFPNEFIEPFLLGGFFFRADRHEWVRKKDGSLIAEDDSEVEKYKVYRKFWKEKIISEKYLLTYNTKLAPHEQLCTSNFDLEGQTRYLAKWKSPKHFKHYGEIWTHWCPKNPVEILAVHESWYKVEYATFVKLLQKRFAEERALKKSKGYGYSGDDCEVFIEKIQGRKR